MTNAKASNLVRDLIVLLNHHTELHQRLTEVIRTKIHAMRNADLSTLQGVREEEKELVLRIHEREGFRRQLIDALGGEFGLDKPTARRITLTELISRVDTTQRVDLQTAADRLRAAVAMLARNNRVAGAIAAGLVHHIKWVWAAVRPTGSIGRGYTHDGGRETDRDSRFFETLG